MQIVRWLRGQESAEAFVGLLSNERKTNFKASCLQG